MITILCNGEMLGTNVFLAYKCSMAVVWRVPTLYDEGSCRACTAIDTRMSRPVARRASHNTAFLDVQEQGNGGVVRLQVLEMCLVTVIPLQYQLWVMIVRGPPLRYFTACC